MSQIKERPILFSAPMVRAILEDRKTVTRRVIKPQPTWDGKWFQWDGHAPNSKDGAVGGNTIEAADLMCWSSPYGKRGDRLWVRETCFINDYRQAGVPVEERADVDLVYRADPLPDWEGEESLITWRPSIHMPRWASRILLEITDVRVERLQDISDEQAQAEGCFFTDYGRKCGHGGEGWTDVGSCPAPEVHHPQRDGWMWDKTASSSQCLGAPRWAFANLWNSVNGPDAWDANPWVWVVEFKRVTP